VIERRLEGLVLDEQPFIRPEARVARPQVLDEPLAALADVPRR
jgi:hypothetical protein